MRPALRVPAALAAAGLIVALGGCNLAPEYVRPTVATPAAWTERCDWKPAEPADRQSRGPWWTAFGDPQLDALQAKVEGGNQSLLVARSQYLQARALAGLADAARWPTLGAPASATRSLGSSVVAKNGSSSIVDDRRFALNAAWEIDLWGRLGSAADAAGATAQAAAADLENARLAIHAELARVYLLLRASDAQRGLLEQTAKSYETTLTLTQNRHRLGVASQLDVLQAETQLRSIRVQIADLGVQRAQYEHAIALLLGQAAGALKLPPASAADMPSPPALPAGLPSQLLERRPDIAAAERRAAAANAQIGTARAAWFPSLTLGAAAGSESTDLSRWFTAPARFWSLGPTLAATLFDGGARRARVEQAEAAAEGSIAGYRQVVLQGFQEVEDNLAALRILADEAQLQDAALDVARRALTLTEHQYRGGTVSYLNVVTAQAAALAAERNALDIRTRRLTASVALVKALGGGW